MYAWDALADCGGLAFHDLDVRRKEDIYETTNGAILRVGSAGMKPPSVQDGKGYCHAAYMRLAISFQ